MRQRKSRTKPVVGFHASHEELGPRTLLRAIVAAEQAGFAAAMCSDHFAPWSEVQGESGFAWSWLGSALEATAMTFGVVTAPGQRYHPAIVAQAIATLSEMYPGRFWAAIGSGEALNEHITGERWPPKELRNARLAESAAVIRALLRGEEVSIDGHVRVDRARLWSLPADIPPVFAAAVSASTSTWAAGWADGLITVTQPLEQLRRTIAGYRDAGGIGPVIVQTHISLAPTESEARANAHLHWRANALGPPLTWDIETPEAFDRAARFLRAEDLDESVLITSEAERVGERVHEYAALGADAVYLHHVGPEQQAFIDAMADKVLPEFRQTR